MHDNFDSITLNDKVLASYNIVYKANFKDDILCLSDLVHKNQVRASEFESFYQQNNLIHVDMLFPNVLADIALEVYLGKVSNFNSYLIREKTFQIIDIESDKYFFKSRIERFVDFLLYSDISELKSSTGELHHNTVYKFDDGVSILYFNSLNYLDLIQVSLHILQLRIDLNKSYTTSSGEVILNLVIEFDH